MYYLGHSKRLSAELERFLIELKFVEEYHWLPQDIRNIPYKFMKMYFIHNSQKRASIEHKKQLDSFKQGAKSGKFTRQVNSSG